MGRPLRIDMENGYHHVMNRGVNRQQIFFSDADRVEFGRLLAEIFERFGVRTLAYCLMTNHYHLVLRCPDGGLSEAMHLLGSVFTRHVNDRVGRDGPLFRGRFHSVIITTDPQLLCSVRYVHGNPLDLPGIEEVDQYRWSSHRTYLGHRPTPPFLDTTEVLDYFGGDIGAFNRFVTSRDAGVENIRLPTLDRLLGLVQLISDDLSTDADLMRTSAARTVVLLLADIVPQPVGQQAERLLGLATLKSAGQARTRARAHAERNPALRTVAERLAAMLQLNEDHLVPGTRWSGLATAS